MSNNLIKYYCLIYNLLKTKQVFDECYLFLEDRKALIKTSCIYKLKQASKLKLVLVYSLYSESGFVNFSGFADK